MENLQESELTDVQPFVLKLEAEDYEGQQTFVQNTIHVKTEVKTELEQDYPIFEANEKSIHRLNLAQRTNSRIGNKRKGTVNYYYKLFAKLHSPRIIFF